MLIDLIDYYFFFFFLFCLLFPSLLSSAFSEELLDAESDELELLSEEEEKLPEDNSLSDVSESLWDGDELSLSLSDL